MYSLKKDNCLSVNSTVAADQSTASLPPTKTAKEKNISANLSLLCQHLSQSQRKLIHYPWPGLYQHAETAMDYFALVLLIDFAVQMILLEVGHTTG